MGCQVVLLEIFKAASRQRARPSENLRLTEGLFVVAFATNGVQTCITVMVLDHQSVHRPHVDAFSASVTFLARFLKPWF